MPWNNWKAPLTILAIYPSWSAMRKLASGFCGHQRNKVLNKKFPNHKIVKTKSIIVNGEKEWEGQVLDKNDHPTGFHVRIVNKPIEWQKMANIIANDNRIAGQYDYNKLRAVIEKYPPPPELEHFDITFFAS